MEDVVTTPGVIPVEIIKAILKVQKDLAPLVKSSDNTEYGSKFTPLPEVMTKALELLNKQGVIVTQSPTLTDEGQSAFSTTLAHKSGAIYREVTKLAIEKINPQSHASAITYMRRYQLMAMLGLTSEDDDDDGNKAAGVHLKATQDQRDRLTVLLNAMSFPADQIARITRNILTKDAASLAIIKYEDMASGKMREREAEIAAIEVEKASTHINVSDGQDQRAIEERLIDLLRDGKIINKFIFHTTGKPFLSKCNEEELQIVEKTLSRLERGDPPTLPNDWYAAGLPPEPTPAADEVEDEDHSDEEAAA